jgi:hypothetical protein
MSDIIDPKDHRQFKRAVATLNKLLEMTKTVYPDALFHIEGDDLQLLTEPHKPRLRKHRNIAARSPLVGEDTW